MVRYVAQAYPETAKGEVGARLNKLNRALRSLDYDVDYPPWYDDDAPYGVLRNRTPDAMACQRRLTDGRFIGSRADGNAVANFAVDLHRDFHRGLQQLQC